MLDWFLYINPDTVLLIVMIACLIAFMPWPGGAK